MADTDTLLRWFLIAKVYGPLVGLLVVAWGFPVFLWISNERHLAFIVSVILLVATGMGALVLRLVGLF